MKTAIKLVLIYFVLLQFVAPFVVGIPCALIMHLNGAELNQHELMLNILLPAQLLGMGLMMLYLWKKDFLKKIKVAQSVLTPTYLVFSILLLFSSTWLISMLMSQLSWIPNIMEDTFDALITSWLGILVIAIIGPVVEEYVFRGGITRSLLEKYSPTKAILISGLIFGVFHINPAQILPAFIMGIIFAWVYYRTASLIPCILMHVINNSLSVRMMIYYPDVKEIDELIAFGPRVAVTCVAALVLVGVYTWMKRVKVDYNWKKDRVDSVEITNPNV